ncbi:MAG: hypothetical protein PVJ27_01990 [Candidatus Brocadiaceae bacterium]|jgi:hypothetical protein
MRRLIIIVLVLVGVAVLVFEPDARRAVVGLYHRTIGGWFRPAGWTPPGAHDVKVYVPRGGRSYHRKGCPRMKGRTGVPTPLAQARELYPPCPECRPPE